MGHSFGRQVEAAVSGRALVGTIVVVAQEVVAEESMDGLLAWQVAELLLGVRAHALHL